ncbi:MAG TPA: YkgJ family cysteine cluster protein [Thermoanaerobaculia bacterium]|jgi:Fe-S-cluster containining protein
MVTLLHTEIDARAAALAAEHEGKLECRRGCFGCCVDDITVFEVEAERIRSAAGAFLATASPHPPGLCAFLGNEGECRIYEVRPYVCRTQGLPLRWIDDEAEVEYRDVCELNEAVNVTELAPEQCWSIGEVEARLAEMNGDGRRVRLRDLFESERSAR